MEKPHKIEPSHSDSRGQIIEIPCSSSKLVIITMTPGSIRGHHYHKLTEEKFYVVSGKGRIYCRNSEKSYEMDFFTSDMVTIPVEMRHAIEATAPTILLKLDDVDHVNDTFKGSAFSDDRSACCNSETFKLTDAEDYTYVVCSKCQRKIGLATT